MHNRKKASANKSSVTVVARKGRGSICNRIYYKAKRKYILMMGAFKTCFLKFRNLCESFVSNQ